MGSGFRAAKGCRSHLSDGKRSKPLQPREPKPPRSSSGFPHPGRRVALAEPEAAWASRSTPPSGRSSPPPTTPRPRQLHSSCRRVSHYPGATLARQGRSGRPWRTLVSVFRLPLSLSRAPPPRQERWRLPAPAWWGLSLRGTPSRSDPQHLWGPRTGSTSPTRTY